MLAASTADSPLVPSTAATKEWVCDSNDAFFVSLVRASHHTHDEGGASPLSGPAENDSSTFHPEYTYPLFDEEQIYGYKKPKLELFYASGSLANFYRFSHEDVVAQEEGGKADDVVGELRQWMPENDPPLTNYARFMEKVTEDEKSFKPRGEKVHEYKQEYHRSPSSTSNHDESVVYEVYKATFETPGFAKWFRRAQLFNIFFIEGATFLEEDEHWEIFSIFQKRQSHAGQTTYHYVGHCTTYLFYCFPDKHRLRISQFVILPPYQRHGHGKALYEFIYTSALARNDVVEVAVEDPSTTFTDIRDKTDLKILAAKGAFEGVASPDKALVERIRRQFKLSQPQARRCTELYFLNHLDKSDRVSYHKYRVFVKQRLYRTDEVGLSACSRDERWNKLAEAYRAVEEEHSDRLAKLGY